MIAKVLRSGSGFSGVIEYLYEGKLENRKADDKRAEVILHSDNLRVPRDWQDLAGRGRMKADFIEQAQSHRLYKTKGKDLIGEHVLSFTQDDMRKLRTKDGLREVTGEYVKLLGLEKTQHVAVLHQDTDNPHLHILFNRVTNDRKKFDDSWEKKRAVAAAVTLAEKHGLHLVGGLSKEKRDPRVAAMRSGMEDLKQIQAQHPVLSLARNLHHLGKLAEKQGLEFEQRADRVKLEGQDYKVSDLEAMFQANRNAAAIKKIAQPAPDREQREARQMEQKREIIVKLETSRAERNSLSERWAGQPKVQDDKERKEQLRPLRPESVAFYLSVANQDGSFNKTSAKTSYKEGATLYELEPAGGNKYKVYLSEQPGTLKAVTSYGPDKTTERTFEGISAVNYSAKSLQTIKPALVQLDGEVFRLMEKGEMDYDNVGIDRENAKQAAEPTPDQKTDVGREETIRLIGEKESEIEDLNRQLNGVEAAFAAQRADRAAQTEVEKAEATTVEISPERKETLNSMELPIELAEAHNLDHLAYRAGILGVPFKIEEQTVSIDGREYPRQELEETLARNAEQNLENRRQYGHEDLLASKDMDQFNYRAEMLEWPVVEDGKDVSVNGESYPKEELKAIFMANREEYHNSLREWEPLLRETQSMDELEAKARDAGAEYQVEEGTFDAVTLNGERYPMATVAAILEENAKPIREQDRELEVRPEQEDLFRAQNPDTMREQDFNHRAAAGEKQEAEKQARKQGGAGSGVGAYGAEKAKKADPIKAAPQPKQPRRPNKKKKKKLPDYLQKLARQKEQQSRSQSHSL